MAIGAIESSVGSIEWSKVDSGSKAQQATLCLVSDNAGRFQCRIKEIDGTLELAWLNPHGGSDAPTAGWNVKVYHEKQSETPARVVVNLTNATDQTEDLNEPVSGTLVVEATGMGSGKKATLMLSVK